jgi:formate dehydrogenase maturation protein FdhE
MHLDPHVAIAAFSTLVAAWLMMVAGLQKSALEQRRRRRVCPSCGRQIEARVCSSCAG